MRSDPLPTDPPTASPGTDDVAGAGCLGYGSPDAAYHNDLTASVRRIYSSDEIGQAPWLRLYLKNTHRRSGSVM